MRFSLGDTLVTLAATALATALLIQFFLDLNAISAPRDEPALGTIVFKRQTATRKAADSQVWERLQDQAPVYALDTLRTAQDSEAVVNFDDGLSLSMLANTMVRLMKGTSTSLDFREGAITVQGSDAARGSMVLGDTGRTLTLSPDAQLVISKSADTMSLELSQGTASVTGPGQAQVLSTTTALDLDVKTGAAATRPIELIPRSPVHATRLLNLGSGPVEVRFEYVASASLEAPTRVQVSARSDFATVEVEGPGQSWGEPGSEMTVGLGLEPGTWYWRVVGGDAVSSVRQLTLGQEAPPALVEPIEGAQYAFRTQVPAVRFAWSPRENVTAWVLEISPGEGNFDAPVVRRRTNLTSLTIDGLEPGPWSWRVVPQYSATLASPSPDPEVRHVFLVANPEMATIEPLVPWEGMTVALQELLTKGLSFSWNPVPQAQGYELTARAAPQESARLLGQFTSPRPYLVLDPDQWSPEVGPTYWSLRWRDVQGQWSPAGPWRTVVVDQPPSLRTIFPPADYRIAQSALGQTVFRWKAPGPVVFQASRRADFSEIEYETVADSQTLGPRDGAPGTWFWRVATPGPAPVTTEPVRFEVVAPFPPVTLETPQPETRVSVLDQQDSTLTWRRIPGAGSYRVSLFGPNEAGGRPIFQAEVDQSPEAPRLSLPLGRWPEGDYVARVQAMARETSAGTAVIGLPGDTPFRVRRLMPLELKTPAEGARLPGLVGRRGVVFDWSSATPVPRATLEIRTPRGELVKRETGSRVVSLPPGEYLWTVRGRVDGLDLSARPSRFTVLTIPPLAAVVLKSPLDAVLGPLELRSMAELEFSWTAPGSGFQFWLYHEAPKVAVWTATVTQPRVAVPKTLLQRGTYLWQVQAQTLGPTGEVEQTGPRAEGRFSIDLPSLEPPELPSELKVYVH